MPHGQLQLQLRAGHSAHPSGLLEICLLKSGASTRSSLKIEIYFLLAIVMMGHHFLLKLGTMWIYKCCSCSLQMEERVLKVYLGLLELQTFQSIDNMARHSKC